MRDFYLRLYMTLINKSCFERGCACYDDRDGYDTVEVIRRKWIGLDQTTKPDIRHQTEAFFAGVQWAETRLKELNT